MSRRTQILKEMGLTPLWRLRGAAADEATPPAEPISDTTPVALATTVTAASERHAAPAARQAAADEPPAWLDEAPLPDYLPESMPDADLLLPADAQPALSSRTQGIARLDWPALQAEVAQCTACGLCQTRSNTVFGVGSQPADWLIVGEAPGAEEDKQGEPFVGQAGKLLDNMLAAIGLQRGNGVFIANVLKCRPPQNRDPNPHEVNQCEPFLLRQIELLQPKLIVAVGRIAAQSLLKTDARIGALRGKVHSYHGVPLIITYHPAYLLRSQQEKAKAWQDLCLARATFAKLQR